MELMLTLILTLTPSLTHTKVRPINDVTGVKSKKKRCSNNLVPLGFGLKERPAAYCSMP